MSSTFLKHLDILSSDNIETQLIEKHLATYIYQQLLASNIAEEQSMIFSCLCLILLQHSHQGHSAVSLDTLCTQLNQLLLTLKQDTQALEPKSIIKLISSLDWCLNTTLNELINLPKLANCPVIFFTQAQTLCFQKQFMAEMRIAKDIMARITKRTPPINNIHSNQHLDDSQQQALNGALNASFSLIYGGPGSGKTSTIFHLIHALQQDNPHTKIALTALTGKAAARIKQSIQAQSQAHNIELNPDTIVASTLHRLLGGNLHHEFRYHAHNPLALDVLIIDEASMLNMFLFKATLLALPDHCRLILLGDPQQLPAIDSGNILHSLIKAGHSHELLGAHLHQLSGQHRFDKSSTLASCLQHIQQRDYLALEKSIQESLSAQSSASLKAYQWHTQDQLDFMCASQQHLIAFLNTTKNANLSTHDKIDAFYDWQILTPFKDSEWGSNAINTALDHFILKEEMPVQHKIGNQVLYHGKPILITQNNYSLGLFNGDIGLCLEDEAGQLYVYFKEEQGLKTLSVTQLPIFEGCYAMSIHKAQGSEFKQVTLLLPEPTSQRQQQLLNQSLIYTAMSRARERASIYSNTDTLLHYCTVIEEKNTLLGGILADLTE